MLCSYQGPQCSKYVWWMNQSMNRSWLFLTSKPAITLPYRYDFTGKPFTHYCIYVLIHAPFWSHLPPGCSPSMLPAHPLLGSEQNSTPEDPAFPCLDSFRPKIFLLLTFIWITGSYRFFYTQLQCPLLPPQWASSIQVLGSRSGSLLGRQALTMVWQPGYYADT